MHPQTDRQTHTLPLTNTQPNDEQINQHKNRRAVSKEEGAAFAQEHGLLFVETSAKTRVNVDEAFSQVAEAVHARVKSGVIDPADEVRGGGVESSRVEVLLS